jgi:hypothetical protein
VRPVIARCISGFSCIAACKSSGLCYGSALTVLPDPKIMLYLYFVEKSMAANMGKPML